MKKVLWVFFLVAFLCAGCTAKTPQANTDLEAPTSVPENQTKISLSHNDKYRGEAYGTITTITAGGLYPYEGIRVVDTSNDEVLWKMEPGYYVVDFAWSPEDRYVGIYYEARIYGESIVFDTHDKKVISLPNLEDIAAHYGQKVKPQENRPDPYFKITGWENPDTAIVEFRWNKEDADYFEGSFTFNVKTGVVAYKSNIQAANRVDIFYGYSSYAMSEYKIETAQFLSEQFNKLSFIPTEKRWIMQQC